MGFKKSVSVASDNFLANSDHSTVSIASEIPFLRLLFCEQFNGLLKVEGRSK